MATHVSLGPVGRGLLAGAVFPLVAYKTFHLSGPKHHVVREPGMGQE